VRAFQLIAWQKPPELREVPVPEPGPGQMLVKVGGARACHSDLHLKAWNRGEDRTVGHFLRHTWQRGNRDNKSEEVSMCVPKTLSVRRRI
jgi:hypothetical protein